MISLKQMRAGCGLLEWTQADLAKECELSTTAINAISRQHAKPRLQTLEKIQKVLETHGVEFIDADGVRLKNNVFKVMNFEGRDAFSQYMNDIVETLRVKGGEGLHIIDDEEIFWSKYRSVFFEYCQQFRKYKLKERLLLREGVRSFYGPADCSTYRWCSHDIASQVSASVYGDKYAIALPDRFVVIENKLIADTYRKQFEQNWRRSKPMPAGQPEFEKDLKKPPK